MEQNKSYFRLGLFVTITVVILAVILFILGGRSLFAPTFTFETYFPNSVAGLEIGAPVKFRGIPLGSVVAIEGTATTYEQNVPIEKRLNYIIVRAKLSGTNERVEAWAREIGPLVKQGLRAQTQLAGITGEQYLALDLLDPATHPVLPINWTPKLPYVPSAPSLTGEIVENARKFIASLNEADIPQLGRNLNKLVMTLNDKIGALPVSDLSTDAVALLKAARVAVDHVNVILAKPDVEATVHNLASASARLDRLLAEPGFKQTVENAARITDRLRKLAESGDLDLMVKNINDAAARIDALVGDNQYDVRAIVQDLRVTADNLRMLSESLKRYPAGALLGGPPDKVQLPGKSP